ncbi:MAG: restriction endonuclease subunit S [Betaproteobacteria bacterium]|nr:restriction endonuclease subunit S [Betaproteobacteria bacterium]MDE2122604.1 restriction endonuclease subunit S [Betaproteobacteria bacterium]MDE2186552.1 restriction endonuclease subunit S [Betaproteobacteria bacterium]MDE2324064.1 restriction endonuclease subunit S [Betaproteobacteria bacterium]
MPEGWRTEELGTLCQFINGLWKGDDPPFVHVGVIRNTNFTKDGALDDSDIAYLDVELKKFQKRRLQFGDLILEKSGGGPKQPVGRVIFFGKETGEFSFSNFTAAIRVINPSELDGRYLHKFLHWVYLSGRTETMQSHSIGIRNLNGDAYKAIPVPLPPLPEQRRIVAILDEAFEAIATAKANTEKNLQNAREVFESELRTLFAQKGADWSKKTLREVAVDFGRGKSKHRPRNDPRLYGGPYPFIQTGDVRNAGHHITEYTQTYSDVGLAQSKLWPRGTLCITIAANIAETGVLDFDACFPDSVIGVVVDERQTTSKYLEYMLQTVKADLKAKGKGSAQDNINMATFENERFPFPDLNEQIKIVRRLDSLIEDVDRLVLTYTAKLTALTELKQSLLHQAFTGALTAKSADRQLEAVA